MVPERKAYNNSWSATVGRLSTHRKRVWESKSKPLRTTPCCFALDCPKYLMTALYVTCERQRTPPTRKARVPKQQNDGAFRGRRACSSEAPGQGFCFPGKLRQMSRSHGMAYFRRSRQDASPHLVRHYFRAFSCELTPGPKRKSWRAAGTIDYLNLHTLENPFQCAWIDV